MLPYAYSPLKTGIQEIRLLNLLPGEFDSPINLTIEHESCSRTRKPFLPKVVTQAHRESVPAGWVVYVISEGDRFIYEYTNPIDCSEHTQWAHPDPDAQFDEFNDLNEEVFGTKPNYEALSYTWGSMECTEVAYVYESCATAQGPRDPGTILNIGQNLTCALRHLRYPNKSRTLWIDAICINQTDIGERSAQVQRMGNLYKLADRVLVWLGPSLPISDLGMSTLGFLGAQIEQSWDYYGLRSPQSTEPTWYYPQTSLPYDQDIWNAIYDILTLPWFERVWCV
jgi:hypothetical protein